MTGLAVALLGVTALAAGVDWWAVARPDRRRVEVVAKPATLVALILVALALEPADGTVRAWFVAALVCSLAGDVFLLFAERWFVAGLASFLAGHLAYVTGFWLSGTVAGPRLAVGAVMVVLALATVGRHILAGVRRADRAMLGPVAAYMVVISAMVASAVGTGNLWAVGGSVSFYASDALIAWNRFIEEQPWGRLAIIVTYHLGQVGLVISLL